MPAPVLEIGGDGLERDFTDRHEAAFVAFAARANDPAREIDLAEAQLAQLAHP